ncbi:MAG: hypothetical protein F6K21_05265 [Symploca sp. SIO2D2]|nr:hypothetical protein [Symploca sp. SIO2D2]
MRKQIIIGGLTGFSLTVLALTTGLLKPTIKLVALSSLGIIPVSIIVSENIHRKANQKVLSLEKALGDARASLKQLENVQDDNGRLSQSLAELKIELSRVQNSLSLLSTEYKKLQASYQIQGTHFEELKTKTRNLSAQVAEYEETYSDELESELKQRISEYTTKDREALKAKYRAILSEGEAIYIEAMEIGEKYKAWAHEVAKRHTDRKNYIMGLTGEFNKRIGEAQEAWEVERGLLLTQIETLNEKVARLQQQLAGDLVEPELLSCKFAIPGQIANELARIIWKQFSIPLSAKGAQLRSEGLIEIGYSYSRSQPPSELVALLSRHTDSLVKELGVHKITSVREHDLSQLIIVSLRREPEVKEDTVKLLAGSPEEFIKYLKSHPWRYRLIAKPGTGKTPTTAVMVSQFLKTGMTLGNTGKGRKIPHSHVVVSCPDVMSSQKDTDYPLQPFLKYGDTTAANKSFQDVEKEWRYRKQNTQYARDISFLMVWDELDNTIKNSSNPKATGEYLVELLRQAHHTGMGWIVSGQSVMTSLIPGFKDDDRDLFTEIVIDTGKIRMYLEKYGKKFLPEYSVKKLLNSLTALEPYIEGQNSRIVDTARELRLAMVLDAKSPKLFFLPNLDNVEFDYESISNVSTIITQYKGQNGSDESVSHFDQSDSPIAENITQQELTGSQTKKSKSTIGGVADLRQNPTCPHCGSTLTGNRKDKRMKCKPCDKLIHPSKIVFK